MVSSRHINSVVNHDFFRFLLVGGTATALQFALLVLLIEMFGAPPVLSSAGSYAVSAVYNYLMNYTLTFRSTKRHIETFPKFVVVAIVGINVNTALFAAFLYVSGIYLLAQCVAVAGTVTVNYLLHKFWIYRS